jgi:monoamine oxidase
MEEPIEEQSYSSDPDLTKRTDDEDDGDGDDDDDTGKCQCSRVLALRVLLGVLCFVALFFSALAITAAITSNTPDIEVPSLGLSQNVVSQEQEQSKVVIVGAGAAGLFAAYTLAYLGHTNFELLEASNTTFGGRTIELDDFVASGIPLDLGAEWIHGTPGVLNNLLLQDADKQKAMPETIKFRPETYSTENGPCCDWLRFFYQETKFLKSTWWSYLNDFIYPYVASNLRLDTVVTTIDHSSSDKVQITTSSGEVIEADQVIVAVPISILQKEVIEFVPPLPDKKQKFLDKVTFAPGLKFWLEFSEHFFTDVILPEGGVIKGPNTDFWMMDALFGKGDDDNHIIAGWNVGPTAEDMVTWSDEEIVASVMSELDSIFGDGVASRTFLNHYHVQNWSKMPYIQGAYSYDWDEFWKDIPDMKEPVDKTIYFAGEYLHEDYYASVHGAAITGRQAAAKVVRDHYDV